MGLHKGMTNNPDGRPVGSKNEKTKQWEALAEDFIGKHTTRFNKVLDNLPDEDFVKAYIMVLGYFRPKLAAQQIQFKQDEGLTYDEHLAKLSNIFPPMQNDETRTIHPPREALASLFPTAKGVDEIE